MATLLPLLLSAWIAELDHPQRLMDQNFGLGLTADQLLLPPSPLDRLYPISQNSRELYYRPLMEFLRRGEGGISNIRTDDDTFQVILDVQQFKPEEINVKLVDRFVVVEAKHEEKRDEHGLISRQFVRKYLLPERADEEKLTSSISSDGVLTITAPLKPTEEKSSGRTIKIELTGKPAIRSGARRGEESGGDSSTVDNQINEKEQSREEVTPGVVQQDVKPEK